MAIRTIHTVPTELPHARLYLDDIEEISSILLAAVAPVDPQSNQEAKVSYAIGDTEMDSINDLQTIGGDTAKFQINIRPFGPTLWFHSFLNPQLRLYLRDEEQAWATYSKIKSIFDRRQLRVRNAFDSLPA